jgi:glycosyltransferase involved in cell wall biosynthesis
LSSFPPRQCGIATFTYDLVTAVEGVTRQRACVVALNDRSEGYEYDEHVCLQIDRGKLEDYGAAAQQLARMPVDVINVQHEYGLFGGEWGESLLSFYEYAAQPIVTTLHSVLSNPGPTLRRVTRTLAERSARVVVLAEAATSILVNDYGVSRAKIKLIPHGIPNVTQPEQRHSHAKMRLGYEDRTLLATFGLISPNKGLEYALHALPKLVKERPDLLYMIIGQTHPGVRAGNGETYRSHLQTLVRDLHLASNVTFVDRYLSLNELLEYVLATDIYVVPYLNPDQIVSGTLAYALGCGKAVVSTPFVHAKEALAQGRGLLTPFCDSAAMSVAIRRLLNEPALRQELERRAYAASRSWIWPEVARQYNITYQEAIGHAVSQVEFQPSASSQRLDRHLSAREMDGARPEPRLHPR